MHRNVGLSTTVGLFAATVFAGLCPVGVAQASEGSAGGTSVLCAKTVGNMTTYPNRMPKTCFSVAGTPGKNIVALKYKTKWGGETVRATGKVFVAGGDDSKVLQVLFTKRKLYGVGGYAYSVVKLRANSHSKWRVFARPWV